MIERREPTAAQIDFLTELRARSDHDPDWYDDPRKMSRIQVQNEIDRLRAELREASERRIEQEGGA